MVKNTWVGKGKVCFAKQSRRGDFVSTLTDVSVDFPSDKSCDNVFKLVTAHLPNPSEFTIHHLPISFDTLQVEHGPFPYY
jgi:hypothetical protein